MVRAIWRLHGRSITGAVADAASSAGRHERLGALTGLAGPPRGLPWAGVNHRAPCFLVIAPLVARTAGWEWTDSASLDTRDECFGVPFFPTSRSTASLVSSAGPSQSRHLRTCVSRKQTGLLAPLQLRKRLYKQGISVIEWVSRGCTDLQFALAKVLV